MPNVKQDQWARQRDIPIAILAWVALLLILFYLLHFLIHTIIILLLSILLAYALLPVVSFLQKLMPRVFAVLLAYLLILTGLGFLLYFVISLAVIQFTHLIAFLTYMLSPQHRNHTPLITMLQNFGITQQQISGITQQLTIQAEHLTSSIVPFLSSIITIMLDILLVAILSVYLLIDGSRITEEIKKNTPLSQKKRIDFALGTFEKIVGRYIRGQLLLALIVGVLVGFGMFLFHVPYAVLLGVLAFILEFIPVLGTIISGAICVLLAFTQGMFIALLVLLYFIIIHIVESDMLGPRIVGQAVGLHPIVSIIALIAGSELFGIFGTIFAAPVAGILQVLVLALVTEWKQAHPEDFIKQKKAVRDTIHAQLPKK